MQMIGASRSPCRINLVRDFRRVNCQPRLVGTRQAADTGELGMSEDNCPTPPQNPYRNTGRPRKCSITYHDIEDMDSGAMSHHRMLTPVINTLPRVARSNQACATIIREVRSIRKD